MDRLDLARRRFTQITESASPRATQMQAEELASWLEQDVCGVVEKLWDHDGFRHRVRWPIDRLCGREDQSERQMVLTVDRALVNFAAQLSSFARQKSVDEKLRRLERQEGTSSNDNQADLELSTCQPFGLSAVEFIAQRPWRDLASPSDYFFPVAGLNLKKPDSRQWGMFSTFVNPLLRPPGDFISRGLQIRIEHWTHYLQRFWVRCHAVVQQSGEELTDSWPQVTAAKANLSEQTAALRAMCSSGPEARLRDSCIALLHVMVGCRPGIDISWLGVPMGLERNVMGMPAVVRRRHNLTIADRIAAALADVADMMRQPPTPDEVIESARRAHQLVFATGPGVWRMIWDDVECGQTIADKPALRDFLWALAQRAKTGQCVEANRWKSGTTALKDRRYHLRGHIPESLRDRIQPSGDGAYKLDLPGDEICLLAFNEENSLQEFDCLHTLPF
jgi:hypothetical protein